MSPSINPGGISTTEDLIIKIIAENIVPIALLI
jgi:hypothetical protein